MFKTIFARFGNIKAGNFVSEDGENLSDVQKVLAQFDIQLYDTQGNMNNLADIIDTVANKWGGLNDVERNALATAIAGTRQRENFLVLMENYNNALNYETVAMNSSGSAMQKYSKYLQGVEASQEKLTATFEKLSQKAVDSGLIKGFYDLGSAFLNILSAVAPLVPWLVRFGVAIAIGKTVSDLSNETTKLGKGLGVLKVNIKKLVSQFKTFGQTFSQTFGEATNKFKGFKTALSASFKASGLDPVSIGITATISAIEIVVARYQKYKQNLEEAAQKAQETASQTTGYYNSLISLQEKYNKLVKGSSSLEERQSLEEEINKQVEEINESEGLRLKTVNLVNGALSEQGDILKENAETVREQTKEDIEAALQAKKEASGKHRVTKGFWYGGAESYEEWLGEDYAKILGMKPAETKNEEVSIFYDWAEGKLDLEQKVILYDALIEKRKKLTEEGKKADSEEIVSLNKGINAISTEVGEYKALEKQLAQNLITQKGFNDEKLVSIGTTDEAIKTNFEEAKSDSVLLSILKEIIGAKQEEAEATQVQIDNYGEIAKLNYADLKNELSELQGAYDALSTAVTDYNEKGYISIDTFESLIDTYNDYLPLLVNENGQLQLNTQTIYNAMVARIQEMAVSKALARIKEFENKSDSEAKKLLSEKANALRDLTGAEVQNLIMSINRLDVSAETKKAIYNETVGYLKLADAAVKGLGKASSATSSASKTETKYSDAIKFAQSAIQKKIDALNNEKEAIEKLNEERQKELDYYDKAISYVNTVVDERISALEKEKDALKEKNDETSKEIELEKLKQNLAKAQKTKVKVFRKGQGFVWETDKSAVDEAQKAIDDFYSEEKQNAIQKQIDAWNEYKEALGGISTAYEEEQAKEAFLKKQGFITEEGINNRNLSEIERFKNAYKNKQKQIQETTTDSIDAQIEKWNDLKQSYSDITSNYEYEQERQKAISILGANAEQQILSGRLSVLQEFTRGYTEEMNKQVAAANNAASGINTAYSSTSYNIPTADQAGFEDGAQNQAPMFSNRFRASNTDIAANKLKNSYKVYDVKTIDDLMYFKISDKFDTWIRYYESTIKNKKIASYDPSNKILLINKKEKKRIYNQYAQGTKSSISGLANVNELGDELFVPPSRGNYQVLQKGTGILNHGLTERLMSMARNPQSYIKSSMAQMGISTSINKGTTQNITIGNVNLPNVSNAQSFVRELKLISQNR